MRRFRLFALTLAAGLVAAACGPGGSTNSNAGPQATSDNPLNHPVGGTVTIDNESGSTWTCGFNPFSGNVNFLSLGLIYEPLYQVNILKNGAETPWLASSYQWSQNNSVLTFKIRPGVTWSDGQPFTADDVVFTFNYIKQGVNNGLDNFGVWSALSSVARQGTDQVVFTFNGPSVPNFYNVAVQQGIVPKHIWSGISPTDSNNGAQASLDDKPVGTGPFTVGSCTPQNIEYTRSANYWQTGLPRISKIEYPSFLSNDAANNVLAQGSAQWGSQYIPNIDSFWTSKGQNRHWWFPPILNVSLIPNLTKAPLDNPKVRQAFAYAIDRAKASKVGENGYEPASNQTGIVTPTYKDWYDNKLATQDQYNYTFNAGKATSLLQSAGYTKGSDGIMADSGGHKLSFEVITNNGYSDWIATLQVVEQELKDIGIELTTKPLDPTPFLTAMQSGDFTFAYYEQPSAGPTPFTEMRAWLYSANSAPVGQTAPSNFERYLNKDVDTLFDQFAATTDTSTQHQLMSKIEEAMLKDVPLIPVTEGVDWYQYDTSKIGGWVTQDDPYAQPAAFIYPDWEVLALHLYQK